MPRWASAINHVDNRTLRSHCTVETRPYHSEEENNSLYKNNKDSSGPTYH